ncbi:MAG: LysR family transcriptional regulator, partial [Natronospirillum sp.]
MTIMKWNLSDIPIFTAVVDHNGITAAAKALKIPKSTISRTLSRLEEDLNVRLLERNSRNMRLTYEGSTFFKECKVIMEQVESANALLNGLTHKPSGPLHVSMPIGFARHVVSGRIH